MLTAAAGFRSWEDMKFLKFTSYWSSTDDSSFRTSNPDFLILSNLKLHSDLIDIFISENLRESSKKLRDSLFIYH